MQEQEYRTYLSGCNYIFQHYGIERQKQQLIQECAELIVALTKKDLENILEEMADVSVLFTQFTINPFYKRKIEKIALSKVKRQLERIHKEKK